MRYFVMTTYKQDFSMGEECPRVMYQEINYGFIELVVMLFNEYPGILGEA